MEHFEAYSVGIYSASVCTNLSIKRATTQLNRTNPTGIKSKWILSTDKTFRNGEKNGKKCEEGHAPGAKHYLFIC